MIRVAINGYGRIGRNILRAIYDAHLENEIEVVAINDLADFNVDVHLTRFDSTHGRFNAELALQGDKLIINGRPIQLLACREMFKLPWAELDIDIVLECTGLYKERAQLEGHLLAGAKKVLMSAPLKDADITTVYGVNDGSILAEHAIVSNASCTTNCLAPLVAVLDKAIGVECGQMTTIHAYTNDQSLIDHAHGSDLYRARTAATSMIPSTTGAANAVGLVLPEMAGKLTGMAIRVPTLNVSIVDLHFRAMRNTTAQEIHEALKSASEKGFHNIIEYCDIPLVSVDFNHNPASCIYDALQTSVINEREVKVMAWYDNEWGFSNRMLDTLRVMHVAGYTRQGRSSSAQTSAKKT